MMIRKILRRIFLIIVVLFLLYLVVTNISFFQDLVTPPQYSFLIDADTGNEQDDLFAIARAFIEPNTEIIGLCSSQWYYGRKAPDSTVWISQSLNDSILRLANLTLIPNPVGSDWKFNPQDSLDSDSPAARFIIRKARNLRSDEKLKVVILGAMTNVATAITLAPEIIPRLECYVMGLKYDPLDRVWNKNEFNTRNDLDAADVLLNAANLDLHVMTATASEALTFSKEKTFNELRGKGALFDFLVHRWQDKYPEHDEWVMWDLAIIEAMLHPEMATEKKVFGPPENTQRKIWVYTGINAEAMEKDFFAAAERFSELH